MKTITVENSFGKDKQITRLDFITQWYEHMGQLNRLSWDHADEFKKMQMRISEIAGEEFDRLWEKANA